MSDLMTPSTHIFDISLWEDMLDDGQLTAEEKHEALQILWNLMCEFVFIGHGVHPLQQTRDKSPESGAYTGIATEDMLCLLNNDIEEKGS